MWGKQKYQSYFFKNAQQQECAQGTLASKEVYADIRWRWGVK